MQVIGTDEREVNTAIRAVKDLAGRSMSKFMSCICLCLCLSLCLCLVYVYVYV